MNSDQWEPDSIELRDRRLVDAKEPLKYGEIN